MLNVAIAESHEVQTQPRNGLEAWFLAMGQTDFARMDEDKPLVHEVNSAIKSEYRITVRGVYALRADEHAHLAQMN